LLLEIPARLRHNASSALNPRGGPMRILILSCCLFFLTACCFAQDTNFANGPQYLPTGSSLLSHSIATPTLSLDAPLPPVEPPSFNIPEAATEVPFTTNPLLEHQADLIPIYYGVPNYYEVSAASVVEISFPEGAESSAALPASIVESGVTELVDAQALRARGHGVTVAEAAAYWKNHKLLARRRFTNEDVKRLHAAS
jgi:hypothetical protein